MVDEGFGFTSSKLIVRWRVIWRGKLWCDTENLVSARVTYGHTCIIISFISRDEGVPSNDLSKDWIGRDPLRQFPDKFSSFLPVKKRFPKYYTLCVL